jgi:hypothetical protein
MCWLSTPDTHLLRLSMLPVSKHASRNVYLNIYNVVLFLRASEVEGERLRQ